MWYSIQHPFQSTSVLNWNRKCNERSKIYKIFKFKSKVKKSQNKFSPFEQFKLVIGINQEVLHDLYMGVRQNLTLEFHISNEPFQKALSTWKMFCNRKTHLDKANVQSFEKQGQNCLTEQHKCFARMPNGKESRSVKIRWTVGQQTETT